MNAQEKFHPQLTITVCEDSSNLRGYLVIDSTIRGRAVGGVRMLPDVSLGEIQELARTMTLKYGFSGLALGGAKAGIVADPEMPAGEKGPMLVNFARALHPILKSRCFIPRPDMGTSNPELREACEAAGLRKKWRRTAGGGRSGLYTSFTVLAGAIQALQRLNRGLAGSTVSIEGFGKVGSSVAMAFYERGSKVVAVSTMWGAIYCSRGLNVPELLRLHERYGSRMVEFYSEADPIKPAELLELDVDVLSPCARHHSIHAGNAPAINAKIISAGANNPTTRDAERILFGRGKICLPDFATNCGGALGEAMEFTGLSEAFIRDFLVAKIGSKISGILDGSEKTHGPPREYAEPLALERFFAMKEKAERPDLSYRVLRAGAALYRSGLVPQFLVRSLSPRYFAAVSKS